MAFYVNNIDKIGKDSIKQSSGFSHWNYNILFCIDNEKNQDIIKSDYVIIGTAITNNNEYPCRIYTNIIKTQYFNYFSNDGFFAYAMLFEIWAGSRWVKKWYAIDGIYTNDKEINDCIQGAFKKYFDLKIEKIMQYCNPQLVYRSIDKVCEKMRFSKLLLNNSVPYVGETENNQVSNDNESFDVLQATKLLLGLDE